MNIMEPLGQGTSISGVGQGSNLDNAEYVYCVDRKGTDDSTSYIHITNSAGANNRSIAINNDTDGIILKKLASDKIYATTALGPGSTGTTAVFFTKVNNPGFMYNTKY